MDLATDQQIQQIRDNSHLQIKPSVEIQTKVPKRSFDVAFLMLPDEKLKQKEKAFSRSPEVSPASSYPLTELTVRSDLINRQKFGNKVFINGDYSAVFKTSEDRYSTGSLNSTASSEKSDDTIESDLPKSAFSKVTQIINVDSPIPPAAISPDQLSCSSASPPISYSPPTSHGFRSEYSPFINSSAFQAINQPPYSPQKHHQKSLIYRGNPLPAANNNNAGEQGYLHAFQQFQANPAFMAQPEQFIRNPAAAILSTLLPTSLSSLSLPAQNVCAKCNISFRMTSDLVYHMRSHHKNESSHDPQRRKREEKLKCPVCSESFRERHHLTRHMTAHQDKEGDLLDHEIAEYHSRRK
jgi:PR domain zinc finger protein 8